MIFLGQACCYCLSECPKRFLSSLIKNNPIYFFSQIYIKGYIGFCKDITLKTTTVSCVIVLNLQKTLAKIKSIMQGFLFFGLSGQTKKT